jgi:NTE family protein
MAARRRRARIGLALAGGGPLGAIYEIGALCAIDDALVGHRLADCDAFVGVSAGGFIAAALANGLTPRELWASFIANQGAPDDIFEPRVLMRPAWQEFGDRLGRVPGLLARAGWRLARGGSGPIGALRLLAPALPAGLFSNEGIHRQLARQFAQPGRTNDFRGLQRRLVLVATDLDTGEAVPFGRPGFDHVPISRAVQASAALPGLYPPVEIDGRTYVDGALKKTLHASVLLDEGLDLLLCLNPLVPFDASPAPGSDASTPLRLTDGGLAVVLGQTFRTLIRSRLEIGLKAYAHSHPRTAIVLVEPDARDPAMFFAGTFGYAHRRRLAAHAYRRTLDQLSARRDELAAPLARAGLALDPAVLADHGRSLEPPATPRRLGNELNRLDAALDALEDRLAGRTAA